MPYDRTHVLMTWGGPLADTEQWSCSVRFANVPSGNPVPPTDVTPAQFTSMQSQVDAVWSALSTWMTSGSTGAQIGALAKLGWLKLAHIGLTGDYLTDAWVKEATPVSPPQTTTLPPQCAYVVSLRSGNTLGRANYGRFYVPTPSWSPGQSGGVVTDTVANNARTAARTMLKAAEAALQGASSQLRLAIMSYRGFEGTTKIVSDIGVGRVVDTQRRRRSSLNEAMTLVPFGGP